MDRNKFNVEFYQPFRSTDYIITTTYSSAAVK